MDDSGNINAKTVTNGDTDCSEKHIYKHTMFLGFQDSANPKAGYLVTVQCQQRWVWNHCDMPPEHTVYPIVIEPGKHGTFKVYAATSKQLGAKTKVAKFVVLDVSHVAQEATK